MTRTDPRPHYGQKRRVRSEGYVDLWDPAHPLARADGYVFEHRKVAWEAGILTDPTDHVHHVNGHKADNRPENLVAVDAATHQREHHALVGGPPAENARKTHCINGHPLEGDNLYPARLPYRVCVTCARDRARAQHAKTKALR